ncbi:MAG TPA: N-acetyltransferase [Candidatus Paceibacterota bacterium]|nr:N-acetyltransferase [Candidatus Paceibacterota bacterium]
MDENKVEKALPEVSLNQATADDETRFHEIDDAVESRTCLPIKDFAAEMKDGPVLMIKKGEETVGFTSYQRQADGSIYINSLYIDPNYQKQGIGRATLSKVMEMLKDEPRIWLVTHPENPAVQLYESFGFKIKERKENYFGNGEPRYIMEWLRSEANVSE